MVEFDWFFLGHMQNVAQNEANDVRRKSTPWFHIVPLKIVSSSLRSTKCRIYFNTYFNFYKLFLVRKVEKSSKSIIASKVFETYLI